MADFRAVEAAAPEIGKVVEGVGAALRKEAGEILGALRKESNTKLPGGVAGNDAITHIDASKGPFESYDQAGYRWVQPRDSSGADARNLSKDAAVPPSAESKPADPYEAFDASGYRWVGARGLAMDIRTAQGPTLTHSSELTKPEFSFGEKGIANIRLPHDATPEDKAHALMTGGFANMIFSDPLAEKAASIVERDRIGFIGGKTTAFASPEEAQQIALDGSRKYLDGEAGNNFTKFLAERFGPMTAEQRAWGTHIFTDMHSPESAWSSQIAPATTTLLHSGMRIEK